MAEYIEREALYEKAYWHGEMPDVGNPYAEGVEAVDISDVDAIPAADVAPVVHGRWIPSESDFDDDDVLFDVDDWCDWQCSACHNDICYEDPMERRWLPKYCPNCGAKMDKEGKTNERDETAEAGIGYSEV